MTKQPKRYIITIGETAVKRTDKADVFNAKVLELKRNSTPEFTVVDNLTKIGCTYKKGHLRHNYTTKHFELP